SWAPDCTTSIDVCRNNFRSRARFFRSAYWRSRSADFGPRESHAASSASEISPVLRQMNSRRSRESNREDSPRSDVMTLPRRSALFAFPSNSKVYADVSGEQMVERPRVSRLRRMLRIIVSRDHRRNRLRIHREHHENVGDAQHHDYQHGDEMPVARPHVAAEERCKRGELNGLPYRDAGENGKQAGPRQREIGCLLQRVVLALMRMILATKSVEFDHLPAVADVAFARNQIAPLAVQIDEGHVNEPVDDEHPHHREVPVPRATEPAAEGEPVWNRFVLERIAAEDLTLSRKRRV